MKLTDGELAMLQRLRLGRTQAEQAAKLRMSLWAYRRLEKDLHPDSRALALEPEEHERLLVRRMRAKLTRANLAKKLKLSEFWVYRMESGQVPCDALRDYWSKR